MDPALVAFVKCHVTSRLKWEALRLMAEREGKWLGAEDIARVIRRPCDQVDRAMRQLAREGVVEVVEELRSGDPDDTSYRLPRQEPSTVVLRRLIETSLRSQELRGIIAANIAANNGRHRQSSAVPV